MRVSCGVRRERLNHQPPFLVLCHPGCDPPARLPADPPSLICFPQDHTHRIKLRNSSRNFERGRSDIFSLVSLDIGDVQYVMVRKDEAGVFQNSDWHLSAIEVLHPGARRRHERDAMRW